MNASLARRIAFLIYGITCYTIFFGVFLYAIGFMGNFAVPTALDGPATGSLGTSLGINLGLLAMFAIQHSGMARPTFKKWWTQYIPKPLERSTYVLFSNVAMIIIFTCWQPMGGVVWGVENNVGRMALYSLFGLGWATVFYSTCLLNQFELFGLRQVWLYFRNRPYTSLPFRVPSLYRYVRHPLYVGWLMAIWITPTMTMAHLLFALGTTGYILIAIKLEERNLADALPEYAEYRKNVSMLIPFLKGTHK